MPKSINDYTPMEQLAIKQAVYKKFAAEVDTKSRDNLRAYVSSDIVERYAQTGARTYDIRVEGAKVGTISVKIVKEKPERRTKKFTVTDEAALFHWFPEGDFVDKWLYAHWREFAQWYFEATGELPDGCEMAEQVVPGTPEHVDGTVLRIDTDKVENALTKALPSVAGLLGGDAE